MLKHIVCWKITDTDRSKEENIREMKRRLESLPDHISEIKEFEVGINSNPSEAAFDIALYSGFSNEANLEAYRKHPEHKKVAEFINSIAEDRVVVDYEV